MKLLLLFFVLTCTMPAIAQDMEKDTLQLKEVVVNNKKHRTRNVSYKFRSGICTFYANLPSSYETATMAYDMPKGLLKTLRFDFNHASSSDRKDLFVDTQIEVSLYDVTNSGDPGKKLGSKVVMVPGSHSGKMDIDVSDLLIRNENGIYISLSKVKKEDSKATDFEVDCSCKEHKNHRTLIYNPKSKRWLPSHGPYAFELTVTIEQ